jgi:hypothetical protein
MSSSSDGCHAHSRAAYLAADPRSVLGSGAARTCQQPGLGPGPRPRRLRRDRRRGGELAGSDPEGPRGGADLAQRGDRQQAARSRRRSRNLWQRMTSTGGPTGRPLSRSTTSNRHRSPTPLRRARSRAWPMAHRRDVEPQKSMPRRASHTAPSPCPQARSRACPAVGNMASKGANTGGGPTAATGAGPRLAYLLSQRTRSLSVTAVTLRSGREMK